MPRITLLALLALFVALTGVFGAESRVAGCAPNFHWTDFGPVWSPTGDKIAYQRIEIGCFSPIKTYVIGADGGTPVRMPLDGGRPSWSPDGRRLAFSYNLLIANADGSGSTELRRGLSWHPTWSPDGRFITFASGSQHLDVYVIGSDGFGERNLTNTASQDEATPSWSPRGDLIAFFVGSPFQIAVMAPDGTGRRSVYTGRAPQSEVIWSPDGTRLAFVRFQGIYTSELVVVDVASGTSRVVASGSIPYNRDPAWSPDSSRLAFSRSVGGSGRPDMTIRTIGADGSDERDLGRGSGLAWSPDGLRIAFAAFGDHCPTRTGIYVAVPDRASERRLTNECRIVGTPQPDVIKGSYDDDLVLALAGNDRISGSWGEDRIDAGEGNDRVHGGQARDSILGGPGNDVLFGDEFGDTIVGGPGRDRISGGPGFDVIRARDGNVDRISCGRHRDVVYADRRDVVARDCERVRRG